MNFKELAEFRQSCRNYDISKEIDDNTIKEIIETSLLAPSACNGQPYRITICKHEKAQLVAKATQGIGLNKFTENVPVMIVISEDDYVKTAAIGAKLKHNDYRSIDIGILSAYITAAATEKGLGTCIIGWFDNNKIMKICNLSNPVRLIISLGYPSDNETHRTKKRKDYSTIVESI